ncbi:MAG: carboxypeptidase-like regulatory domain-containing protein [Bryobacteraceae bacterium]
MTLRTRFLLPGCILLALINAPGAQAASSAKPRPLPPPRHSISGHISGLEAPHHATVVATGPHGARHSTATHPDGTYIFHNLTPGTYNIRPSQGLYRFTPTFHTVAVTNHDVHNVSFAAHEQPRPHRR